MRIEMPTAELLQQAARMVTTPGVGMTPSQIEAEIAAGRLQPQWSQVAFDGEGSIVGRALWWGRDGRTPLALDVWDAVDGDDEPVVILGELLERGHAALAAMGIDAPLPHTLRVPTAWRDIATVRQDVQTKITAAAGGGLRTHNERLQFQWEHDVPVPQPTQRLRFEPAEDDTFIDLFARAAYGSLDVMTQRELAATDARHLARDEVDYYRSCPGTAPGGASRVTATVTSSGSRSRPPPRRTATSATSPCCPSIAGGDTATICSPSSQPSTPQQEQSGSLVPPTL